MRKLVSVAAAALLGAGCAAQSARTPERPLAPGPFPENYEAVVKDWLKVRLKDPYSIQDLSISRPVPERRWVGLLNGSWIDAYVSCVRYNAKNSYGGYVGLKEYSFVLKDGAVARGPVAGEYVGEGC